jgi:SAM-dependent methyltransferase
MGDKNQLIFIQRNAKDLHGPYLEVGSKDYGSTQDLKPIFSKNDTYIGVDIEQGPGVDFVLDLTKEFDEIDAKVDHMRFGTIFCLSVLEHCTEPFKAAENLTRLLKPKGKICIAVPFSWKYHGYPSDYWRFTHEGIKVLFPEVVFDLSQGAASTSKKNEFRKLDNEIGKISFSFTTHWKNGHLIRGISAKLLKLLSRCGVLSWFSGYRYVMAPTNILMIGTLKN